MTFLITRQLNFIVYTLPDSNILVLFLVGLLPLIFEGYESTQELVVCVEASLAPDPDPLTVVWFCGSDLEV